MNMVLASASGDGGLKINTAVYLCFNSRPTGTDLMESVVECKDTPRGTEALTNTVQASRSLCAGSNPAALPNFPVPVLADPYHIADAYGLKRMTEGAARESNEARPRRVIQPDFVWTLAAGNSFERVA